MGFQIYGINMKGLGYWVCFGFLFFLQEVGGVYIIFLINYILNIIYFFSEKLILVFFILINIVILVFDQMMLKVFVVVFFGMWNVF